MVNTTLYPQWRKKNRSSHAFPKGICKKGKCKQPLLGFELWSPIPFPTMWTIMLSDLPFHLQCVSSTDGCRVSCILNMCVWCATLVFWRKNIVHSVLLSIWSQRLPDVTKKKKNEKKIEVFWIIKMCGVQNSRQ